MAVLIFCLFTLCSMLWWSPCSVIYVEDNQHDFVEGRGV